jgi:hypothetical protein
MANRFNIGDIVECIDTRCTIAKLKEGDFYRITSVGLGWVVVDGIDQFLNQDRFVFVTNKEITNEQ